MFCKRFLISISLLVLVMRTNAQCVFAVTQTITPATFLSCGSMTVNAGINLDVNGTVSLTGGTTIDVVNNGVLTIQGDLTCSGNSGLNLSGIGLLVVTGNLDVSGNVSLSDGGSIHVNGDASFSGSSSIGGSGSLTSDGTTSTSGSATVFGGTGSCTGCTTSGSAPLPIELVRFTASLNSKKVDLNWASASETNNKYYTVERSTDAQVFKELIMVNSKAMNGNSTVLLEYKASDESPLSGVSYYRLKQTDYNGSSKHFSIVSVRIDPNSNVSFSIAPNPNHGEFTVDFSGIENNHEVQILLHDALGKQFFSGSFFAQETQNSVQVIPTEKLVAGVYFCSLVVEGIKYNCRVIVN